MVEVSHVTKRYGSHVAVDNLSFTIGRGQTYGFLGPNGAGKSTTMNIMTGCLAASEGEVRIGGYDIFEQAREAKRLIGYLPELPPLYPDSTPREYLRLVGAAKGIPPRELSAAADAAMKLTDIGGMADRLIKNLSKGYRQRVGIAQAILGSPEIIILDEPTAGLDPKQIVEIRELIKELGKTHTVVLSSHILSEVQAVCGTILIISKGRLAACDTPENLERLFAGAASVELEAECTREEAAGILSSVPGAVINSISEADGGVCRMRIDAGQDGAELNRRLFFAFAAAKRLILHMTRAPRRPSYRRRTAETAAWPRRSPEGQRSDCAGALPFRGFHPRQWTAARRRRAAHRSRRQNILIWPLGSRYLGIPCRTPILR